MSLPHLWVTPPCLDPAQLCFHLHPQTTIHLGGGIMEEKLWEGNRIKGFYALVDKYGGEERVAWMPDLVDWVSSQGGGLCAAWLLRRIRCSHSVVTQELVTGDVMRSDYRLVHRLAAKGWPIIPQSLKECFVKSGWKRGKKKWRERSRGGNIRGVWGNSITLDSIWKASCCHPGEARQGRMWGKPAERLLQPGNKTCLVPGLRSKQIKMNWCKLSDFGEWGRKNAHRSIRLRKQATKDRISTHILGDNTQWRTGSQILYIPTLCGLDKKRGFGVE